MKNTPGKGKRIAAIIAIILIIAMYAAALIFSFSGSELGQTLFRAALGCTMLVPVLLYMMVLIARTLKPKKSAVIDAVVFDLGRVLVDFPWNTFTAGLDISEETRAEILEKVDGAAKLWRDFDLNLRPYSDIVDDFCRLDPSHAAEIRQIVEHEQECVSKFWFTDDLIRSLKNHGYKVYYLSNWTKEWYDDLKDTEMDFLKKMDGGIFSFEVHMAKPDQEIFRELTSRFKLNPNRAIFIDDTKENTDAAKKAGFSAITFTEYNDMIEKLESVGVVL